MATQPRIQETDSLGGLVSLLQALNPLFGGGKKTEKETTSGGTSVQRAGPTPELLGKSDALLQQILQSVSPENLDALVGNILERAKQTFAPALATSKGAGVRSYSDSVLRQLANESMARATGEAAAARLTAIEKANAQAAGLVNQQIAASRVTETTAPATTATRTSSTGASTLGKVAAGATTAALLKNILLGQGTSEAIKAAKEAMKRRKELEEAGETGFPPLWGSQYALDLIRDFESGAQAAREAAVPMEVFESGISEASLSAAREAGMNAVGFGSGAGGGGGAELTATFIPPETEFAFSQLASDIPSLGTEILSRSLGGAAGIGDTLTAAFDSAGAIDLPTSEEEILRTIAEEAGSDVGDAPGIITQGPDAPASEIPPTTTQAAQVVAPIAADVITSDIRPIEEILTSQGLDIGSAMPPAVLDTGPVMPPATFFDPEGASLFVNEAGEVVGGGFGFPWLSAANILSGGETGEVLGSGISAFSELPIVGEVFNLIGSGCFVTTAATKGGELDNGFTLSHLRDFRSSYMQETPERLSELLEYYLLAPYIVHRIDALPSLPSEGIYKEIRERFLDPAVLAFRMGKPEITHQIYKNMMYWARQQVGLASPSPSPQE